MSDCEGKGDKKSGGRRILTLGTSASKLVQKSMQKKTTNDLVLQGRRGRRAPVGLGLLSEDDKPAATNERRIKKEDDAVAVSTKIRTGEDRNHSNLTTSEHAARARALQALKQKDKTSDGGLSSINQLNIAVLQPAAVASDDKVIESDGVSQSSQAILPSEESQSADLQKGQEPSSSVRVGQSEGDTNTAQENSSLASKEVVSGDKKDYHSSVRSNRDNVERTSKVRLSASKPSASDDASVNRANLKNNISSSRKVKSSRGHAKRMTSFDDGSFGEKEHSLAAFRRHIERGKRRRIQQGDSNQATKLYRTVILPDHISVQELASRMSEKTADVMRELMGLGVVATINQIVDADTAQLVVEAMGHSVKRVSDADFERDFERSYNEEDKVFRSPVVAVMGHVDHGKTSLLDALRKANVTAKEAGGITQHIGAYQVHAKSGATITMLDTPGHAAFSAMRARGAKTTDIVILVVAADDGVSVQTIEAIKHAQAADVPIVVAINKIDKPGADPHQIATQLLQHEIVLEAMGGDVLSVEISALKHINLDKLIDTVLLQAELLNLKAVNNGPAEGIVLEAAVETGRGSTATMLVQQGCLSVGDIVVAGVAQGRIRAMFDDGGHSTSSALPVQPVVVTGFASLPEAGDRFAVVDTEARANEIVRYRQHKIRENGGVAARGVEAMIAQLQKGVRSEFSVVVKADVHGSAEAIKAALESLSNDEVGIRVTYCGVGAVTMNDVSLAQMSDSLILAFNVRADNKARTLAKQSNVSVKNYSIIYELLDDMRTQLSGLLAPETKEVITGEATVLEVFAMKKSMRIAGCRIAKGTVKHDNFVRIIRDGKVIYEDEVEELRRFKDIVKEVKEGFECGVLLKNYLNVQPNDILEFFRKEEIARVL